MPDTPQYVIDTCSLTALRRVYPIDVFPSVWSKLDDLVASRSLMSAEDVLEEIKVQDDELSEWASANEHIFYPLDHAVQNIARDILESHPNIIDFKKTKAGSGADPFVIATAIHLSCVVVTEEDPSGGPHKSKIPDVCRAKGVGCIKVLEMLRKTGLRI